MFSLSAFSWFFLWALVLFVAWSIVRINNDNKPADEARMNSNMLEVKSIKEAVEVALSENSDLILNAFFDSSMSLHDVTRSIIKGELDLHVEEYEHLMREGARINSIVDEALRSRLD